MSKYSGNSPSSDRWGAAIAGGILFALPMAGALYRGSLGWIDVVVAIMGIAGLAVAADSFARTSALGGAR